jgi:O-antigen ligase
VTARGDTLAGGRSAGLLVGALLVAALSFAGLALAARGAYPALLGPPALAFGAYALLRRPDAAVAIAAFALYTNAPAVAVQFHRASFAVAAAFPLLLCLPIARDVLLRGRPLVVAPALPFVLAFGAVQLVGALFSAKPERAMDELLTFVLEGLLLYALVTNAIRTPAVLRQVLWSVIAAGAAMGALVTYQHLSGRYDDEFFGFAQLDTGEGFAVGEGSRQRRLGGPLGMPNRFAQIMAVLVPIAWLQIRASRSRAAKLLAGGALALILVGCALGFSRGAAVGLALGFVVMLAMGLVGVRHLVGVALAIGCVALVAPQYAVRLASLGRVADLSVQTEGPGLENADSSTQGRVTEMLTAVLVFADHPILGVGPGMYPEHYSEYARIAGGRVRTGTREAHNLALHVAAEHGILGLAAFGGAVFVTLGGLVGARRRWAATRPELAALATGLLLALVVYLATSLFLHGSYIRYLWFLLAVAGAAGGLREDGERIASLRLVRLSP